MTTRNDNLRAQVLEVGRWSICLPALAFWPFISVLPAFTLVGETRIEVIVPNVLFLLTGFWTVLVGAILYTVIINRMQAANFSVRRRFTGVSMGIFATVWTVAYGTYKLV